MIECEVPDCEKDALWLWRFSDEPPFVNHRLCEIHMREERFQFHSGVLIGRVDVE